VKPFYYCWDGDRFAFASEIKGLLPVIGRPSPSHRAVFDYLEGAYLDYSDGTFFEGVVQLPPAHYLSVEGAALTLTRYWDLPAGGQEGSLSPQSAAERFRALFRDAVRIRLRSDVPIGTCLSGGLDSSSIVCVANGLMFGDGAEVSREVIGQRQKTFSSCFEDPAYDERRFIQPVLERTGAEAHYTFPDAKELAASVEHLIWLQEEPFGSTSIFAQWNVMRLATASSARSSPTSRHIGNGCPCPGNWSRIAACMGRCRGTCSRISRGRSCPECWSVSSAAG
jgi:asparagine synthase (glutamine-hydrolysing)